MSRNIKEIGKELMGKSLSSYHRKTGLSQLEKNNEMQDGILNGILNQVDNAYIEKTEQSNVIHLDGSGDGVVVVDSIEGNTLVNSLSANIIGHKGSAQYVDFSKIKPNTTYTFIYDISNSTGTPNGCFTRFNNVNGVSGNYQNVLDSNYDNGRYIVKYTTPSSWRSSYIAWFRNGNSETSCDFRMMVLEGDWTNKEVPSYFEGLQSSFEESVTDEGQYKIEILSNNKNLFKQELYPRKQSYVTTTIVNENTINIKNTTETNYAYQFFTFNAEPNTTYTFSMDEPIVNKGTYRVMLREVINGDLYNDNYIVGSTTNLNFTFTTPSSIKDDVKVGICLWCYSNGELSGMGDVTFRNIQIERNNKKSYYLPNKQNKIKLLINEPLRSVGDVRDKFVFKDGKLVVERICKSKTYDGSNDWQIYDTGNNRQFYRYIYDTDRSVLLQDKVTSINNRYPSTYFTNRSNDSALGCALMTYSKSNNSNLLCIFKSQDIGVNALREELNSNPMTIVYQLEEPYYEEVLNEYGEPIILEGYENGTLYIDSTIVPTTTVRYTPKMESFNTLKEVKSDNNLLTYDINDNIIPYMMDVDLMIMEKEMDLISSFNKNIRTMEVLDMTSMQKRTQQMLERLIKGRTLTEQECQTRVTTYLNANKITDEQAEELMLLISEVYA